jgi:transketolase
MRREFSNALEKAALADEKIVFLTGDLGFMALENIQSAIPERFINAGVSEQNMISMAAGIASEGYTPVCYSIAPFTVFRPAEQIRLDVCLHNMNVKIVGNGGGYGYGIMGATHHAIEDIAVLSSFQGMKCYIPFCNEDVEEVLAAMMARSGPAYLRLGFGNMPHGLVPPAYNHTRQLLKGGSVTVVGMGPVSLNVISALGRGEGPKAVIDLFVVSEVPLPGLTDELKASIRRTGRLLVVEEHVQRGGLGEHLSHLVLTSGIACRFVHLCAQGYPNGRYGSQSYHQRINGLDAGSIADRIRELANEQ